MRSTVPITVGDKDFDRYSTIKYATTLQAYLVIFYQKALDRDGKLLDEHVIVRKATSKKLSEALSAAIDWVDEIHDVIQFKRSDEARNGQNR